MKKEKPPIPTIAAGSFLIDSHCHLDMPSYADDLDEILTRARTHGVHSIITIGIDEASSLQAVKLAKKHSMVKATVGVHPHDVDQINRNTYNHLRTLASENRAHVVGYGEIGLDYAKQYAEPTAQKKAFQEQLDIAKDLELPVVIHDRDAHDDTLKILRQAGPFPSGGVMHCFSGDIYFAEQIMEIGFFISIPGVVTFKNGKDLQLVAGKVPLQSLILETDGPFLSPVPWRGKRNEPSYLPFTAEKVAQLKGLSIEEVADQTSRNAQKLFNYRVAN
ncbi:MAG: TatD family hydrolase [Thermodesulfobacteriota bacterium]|nr:TatD family hydrolase [Thermodesulfobacteriota bacterium]